MRLHDDLIIECEMSVSLDEECDQMEEKPICLSGIELNADGYESMFYKKGKLQRNPLLLLMKT